MSEPCGMSILPDSIAWLLTCKSNPVGYDLVNSGRGRLHCKPGLPSRRFCSLFGKQEDSTWPITYSEPHLCVLWCNQAHVVLALNIQCSVCCSDAWTVQDLTASCYMYCFQCLRCVQSGYAVPARMARGPTFDSHRPACKQKGAGQHATSHFGAHRTTDSQPDITHLSPASSGVGTMAV